MIDDLFMLMGCVSFSSEAVKWALFACDCAAIHASDHNYSFLAFFAQLHLHTFSD